ncbi:MAG: hypothetical protein ACLGHN_01770 [Bacteriovoracia bacterium]
MKHLFLIALGFVLLNLVTHAEAAESGKGSSMKVEGSCSGTLLDGTAVSFNYYSDFDGIKEISKSAMAFTEGLDGLFTGTRTFKNDNDTYSFPGYKLTLVNSTGNTSAKITYIDMDDNTQTVELPCDVRDYTYEEILKIKESL